MSLDAVVTPHIGKNQWNQEKGMTHIRVLCPYHALVEYAVEREAAGMVQETVPERVCV